MPPEHLQHSRADDSSDTNMLGVSVMNTTQQPQHIQSTSTNAGGEYSLHRSSKTNANNNSYNHSHSSVMNGHGNPSREANNANKDDPKRSKPMSTTNGSTPAAPSTNGNHSHSNGSGVSNDSSSTQHLRHRKLISTTSKSNASGTYYPMRPSRESVLQRLSEALLRRSLHKIDLSQRSLQASDAKLVKMALAQNANLSVLKLGYNNLGDAGVTTLASGIVAHKALNLLDLGFNNIGDQGIMALAHSLQEASEEQPNFFSNSGILSKGGRHGVSNLHTLYLAGNLIGQDGALAMADFLRRGSRLRKLFMTGNRIGGEGVKAISDAILEQQESMKETIDPEQLAEEKSSSNFNSKFHGMQELYLGGTGMDFIGCQALARLLEKSCFLRVLSLPNCDIGDEEVRMLALSIKSNKDQLPIESLQLSFNNITHHGLEAMANALWGSTTLKELKVDNNIIGDRGAHQIAAIIPAIKVIEVLDVGFNSITAQGLTVLMKTVAESKSLLSLSLSGNAIDANAAKSLAYALAFNCSLKSIFLVHCSIGHEEQRHIIAGIVSNSRTALDRLNGFEIGPILLTLGFPEALKNWTNEQVFNFIHLMWEKNDESEEFQSDVERNLDPLSFLSNPMGVKNDDSSTRRSGPLEAAVVVEVAKRFFESLVANGIDVVSRRGANTNRLSIGSPLAPDAIITESTPMTNGHSSGSRHNLGEIKSTPVRSFVAPPESKEKQKQELKDPNRKKQIVEWLCSNAKTLKQMSQIPFDSRELWKLHQFYFTPVVKESGGSPGRHEAKPENLIISSVPEVHRMNHSGSTFTPAMQSVDNCAAVPVSDPAFSGPSSSNTLLKRKVSYRCLGEAASNTEPQLHSNNSAPLDATSVAKIIENGHTGHSLPRKTKRARRNRTRISFLPRIKDKLDSYLDVDHEKALVTMRQLYFVEQAILSGKVVPNEQDSTRRSHLSGTAAAEAEMIIVDMM
eukprot:CAMPEP_0116126854 /NCGR_PEP_ID=MMETSP0329-20121206/6543_1 /TAXON_ID=697910 /ORGANISM="Pseudo-nitzschia arenysensis, Strain B593" /LENGTH=964 /DNA_ID=CAMNT_0003620943 /DNA_START=134 /DNA_END=3028 /DNA_ORIENTATION=-